MDFSKTILIPLVQQIDHPEALCNVKTTEKISLKGNGLVKIPEWCGKKGEWVSDPKRLLVYLAFITCIFQLFT